MTLPPVQTQIYYRRDIRAILEAINNANAEVLAAVPGEPARMYRAGFDAAVRAIATAFDVQVGIPDAELFSMGRREIRG